MSQTLRQYLQGVKEDLHSFMGRAGRRTASVQTLIGNIDQALASGDRALDVADPIELSRGYVPHEKKTELEPAVAVAAPVEQAPPAQPEPAELSPDTQPVEQPVPDVPPAADTAPSS